VIIACGLYLLAEEEQREREREREYWIHEMFQVREEEEQFYTVWKPER